MLGEINMILVMVLIYPLLWELDEFVKDCIDKAVIFSVLFTIFLQTMISLYPYYKMVPVLWRKIKKLRERDLVVPVESWKDEVNQPPNNEVKFPSINEVMTSKDR